MQFKNPPLPPSTKEEFKLFKELIRKYLAPNARTFREMTVVF
jgi:hypothetical protein